ncbi:MAG: serine hydrolase [Fidelibacterota bacterium]
MSTEFPAIDDYIIENMEYFQVPGLALAVVKDDRIIFVAGYGVREVGKPERVDENTLFAIGSISKSTTAVGGRGSVAMG